MRRAAYTLIEMMAVVFVIAALSAIAAPSIASVVKSTRIRNYLSAVEKIVIDATQLAQSSGRTVTLTSDEDGSFQLTQDLGNLAEPTVQATVQATPGLAPGRFTSGSEEKNAGDWSTRFFSDGTSDKGGVEFSGGGDSWYLSIDNRGHGTLQKGELPEMQEDSWPAGDYVQHS